MSQQVTATRHTLSKEWQDAQSRIDWMQAPGMANYVNRLVSDRDLSDEGHWALYALRTHVQPLADRLGRPLRMASLGAGSGHIEEALVNAFNWPIQSITAYEYDALLRTTFTERFQNSAVETNAHFMDFNANDPVQEQFDIVFCCHAIHHADNLEEFLPRINNMIADHGFLLGIDFFGPTRFQVEYEVKAILRELDGLLPPALKADLRQNEPMAKPLAFATIAEVRNADISESVRSSDLRTLLFSTFPVREIKPMGGTLLRWLLQYRAGNFDSTNAEHSAIANLLQMIERILIETNRIRSDDLFFVLEKSEQFSTL